MKLTLIFGPGIALVGAFTAVPVVDLGGKRESRDLGLDKFLSEEGRLSSSSLRSSSL
jgi:hypothetical protein